MHSYSYSAAVHGYPAKSRYLVPLLHILLTEPGEVISMGGIITCECSNIYCEATCYISLFLFGEFTFPFCTLHLSMPLKAKSGA